MANKHTKRALLSSVLALMLCFTMLLGTTFAWFTDSVTSENNIIKSGNLDIVLEYWNGKEWVDLEGADDVLAGDKWEPGYVDVAYLRVKNAGSLALKYQLGVNIVSETAGVNAAGDEFLLSDHIYFDVVESNVESFYATREDAMKDATGTKLISAGYTKAATLEAKTDYTYLTLIAHMPTTVGNVANHNGTDVPEINLGINVVATQLASEKDSFGPDYDKDAIYAEKTYTVDANNTLTDTLSKINSSTATEKTVLVVMDSDMSWETGAGHGSTPWVGENAAVQDLIIDANGATITATGAGVGPIRMANGGTLTIKNAKIVDNSVSYAEGSWELGYLEFAGNVVFENVEFVNAIMLDGESATFVNCSFNSNKDSEYGVWVGNGNATFTNCTFAGPRGLKAHEAYGSEVGTIVVDSCTFDNLTKKPGMAIGTVNPDTTITIKNSDFINCQAGDQGLFMYESDTNVTTFKFDCSQNNEVINLVITTAEELFAFAKSVNVDGNSYAGKLVVLGADIDLNNAEWTPIGQTGATQFQGTFDGHNHTIKNLNIDTSKQTGANYSTGLFGWLNNATVKNLTIENATVTGNHNVGVIAGYMETAGCTISNCHVVNAKVIANHANDDACGDKIGVIVGHAGNAGVKVEGCSATDCTVTAGRDAGQIVGAAKAENVVDCTATNVTVTATGDCTGANIRNEEIGRVL